MSFVIITHSPQQPTIGCISCRDDIAISRSAWKAHPSFRTPFSRVRLHSLGLSSGKLRALRAHGLFAEHLPISVVMHEAATSNLNKVLHDRHLDIRAGIIPPGAPGTMLAVKERLDRGELVGILGDRTFSGRSGRLLQIPR